MSTWHGKIHLSDNGSIGAMVAESRNFGWPDLTETLAIMSALRSVEFPERTTLLAQFRW